MTAWYWTDSGQKRGPCTGDELKELVSRGLVTPETLVWQESYPTWFPASKVQGLFELPMKAVVQAKVLPSLPHEAASRNQTPGSGAAAPRPAMSLPNHNGFDFVADIRSVNFREEVVPIDATNLSKLLTNSVFWGVAILGVVPLFIATLNDQQHQLTAFALFFAALWGVVFKYFVVRKSRDWVICITALLASGFISNVLLWLCFALLPKFYLSMADSQNALIRLMGFVFQVGICEESIKTVPVFAYLAWARRKADVRTVVLVGIFSGLGFAAFENMSYGTDSIVNSLKLTERYGAAGLIAGVQQAMLNVLLRSLSLVFCHGLWTGIVAYFLAVGNLTGRKRIALFLVGLSVAATLHGFYDWLLGIQSTFAAFVVAGSFVLFYAYLSKLDAIAEISTLEKPAA